MPKLSNPIVNEHDAAARKHLEAIRWPDGAYCPRCGQFETVKPLGGKSMGDGWYHCSHCRDKFTVRVGSVFERSKIPLHKWVAAFHLMAASKKGMSAHQLHRMLGITYKSAWFLAHRVREAMRNDRPVQFGGKGKMIEADETYYGRQDKPEPSPHRRGRPYKSKRGPAGKRAIFALVERGGDVRTFHVANADQYTVMKIARNNIAKETRLHADESKLYHPAKDHFAAHETVKHSEKEYVRDDIHTNQPKATSQARHAWHLPALRREAPASVSGRV